MAREVWLIASSGVPNQFVTYPVLDAAITPDVPPGLIANRRDVWVKTWALTTVELDVGGVLVRAVVWPGLPWVSELVSAVAIGEVVITDYYTRCAVADPRRYQRGS